MKKAIVIVASTRAAAGVYEDRSGPIIKAFLEAEGLDTQLRIAADADIHQVVSQAFAENPAVIITSGGTGITPDDQTVEAVKHHLDRELPGLTWAFYQRGQHIPTAILSRIIAGVNAHTFAMALPGSPGGATDGCAVLAPVLNHILQQLEGNHEH